MKPEAEKQRRKQQQDRLEYENQYNNDDDDVGKENNIVNMYDHFHKVNNNNDNTSNIDYDDYDGSSHFRWRKRRRLQEEQQQSSLIYYPGNIIQDLDQDQDQYQKQIQQQQQQQQQQKFFFTPEENVLSSSSALINDMSVPEVAGALTINIILFVVLLSIYEILSRTLGHVYAPRANDNGNNSGSGSGSGSNSTGGNGNGNGNRNDLLPYFPGRDTIGTSEYDDEVKGGRLLHRCMRRIRRSFRLISSVLCHLPLSWLPPILRAPWSRVLRDGGIDAYFFLRYVNCCLRITIVAGVWGCLVLMPVFHGGGGGEDEIGWYALSMTNVTNGSGRIWVTTVFMWLFTGYVLKCLEDEFKHYLEIRMRFLGGLGEGIVVGVGDDNHNDDNNNHHENIDDDCSYTGGAGGEVYRAREGLENSMKMERRDSTATKMPQTSNIRRSLSNNNNNRTTHHVSLSSASFFTPPPSEHPHYASLRNVQSRHTLFIERIPSHLRSNVALRDFFSNLFGADNVHSARILHDVAYLDRLSFKRKRVLMRLEKALGYIEA